MSHPQGPAMTTEDAAARLHDICVREYTRASRDPSSDRRVGARAVLEAEARINAIPTSLALDEFLRAVSRSLADLHDRYSRDDALDPDGWGAGAIGAIENGVMDLRGAG
jgi:hypothetical protein